MRDLTQGSVARLLVGMAGFIGFGLIVQTLYVLVDLYFVSQLGGRAVAGVAAGGSVLFCAMALSQIISVGALSLIAQAIGAREMGRTQTLFEQTLGMSVLACLLTIVGIRTAGDGFVTLLSADEETAQAARRYLFALMPSLALLFPNAALGAALRAGGVVGVPMLIQSATVLLNAGLAPVLVMGWGTGHSYGVAGAGYASSIAVALGSLFLVALLGRLAPQFRLRLAMPRLSVWRQIVSIGLPASAEFFVMFLISGCAYWALRRFGADAQAGFGIGSRVMQAVFLPAMALAFAATPIAAQSVGAGQVDRVRQVFRVAALSGGAIMLALSALCHLRPELMIEFFTDKPQVLGYATGYLRIVSWNFVAVGLVFTCSALFQGLGNTVPALISTASRLVTFVLPIGLLARWPGTRIEDYWHVSNVSAVIQAGLSLVLLRRALGRLGKRGPAPGREGDVPPAEYLGESLDEPPGELPSENGRGLASQASSAA
ncbi:MATE family efflux transporter [Swaminathania salitolerans]|uniref:Multidrug-efflux transporter n=1 Tax=Swaminathania salitolerans TaxID=182838 RepID=A0A511BR08_9PROT|nr:MATE family efflux transporter [Swaminathania salitolerans]GBQ12216.1 MATE efflux family protein [Swaminathania salitolerans LMG 21291]GEL02771.1 MATE family efflux transporter [Swaminathania salitolerans]